VSSLSLGTRAEGARTVVSLTGDLDLATVPSLREVALRELAAPACEVLVLDLAELTFLDSTGLGCWIDLRNQARERGKSIEFVSAPLAARRTVAIAGLAELFGLDADPSANETSAT
jgi:anti-sigma B factor antagonist